MAIALAELVWISFTWDFAFCVWVYIFILFSPSSETRGLDILTSTPFFSTLTLLILGPLFLSTSVFRLLAGRNRESLVLLLVDCC